MGEPEHAALLLCSRGVLLKAIFLVFFFARVALACLHAHAPEEVFITPRFGAHKLVSEEEKKRRVVLGTHILQQYEATHTGHPVYPESILCIYSIYIERTNSCLNKPSHSPSCAGAARP